MKKKYSLLLLCSLFVLPSLCQQTANPKKDPAHYQFVNNVQVFEFDMVEDKIVTPKTRIVGFSGMTFHKVKEYTDEKNKEFVIIRIRKPKELEDKWYRNDSTVARNKRFHEYYKTTWSAGFYAVGRKDYEANVIKTYKTGLRNLDVAYGTTTLPIKLRPALGDQEFDFSSDFSISAVGGIRSRISKYEKRYLTLGFTLGLSAIDVDSASTSGMLTDTEQRSAFTIGLGPVLELGKFQIGGFLGTDLLGKGIGGDWIYQGKPWIAIGLGITLFHTKEEE